jgi:hypothetical protein
LFIAMATFLAIFQLSYVLPTSVHGGGYGAMRRASLVMQPPSAPTDASAKAQTELFDEIAKDQRSLPKISSLVGSLEDGATEALKKKSLQGQWKVLFASDEAAVQPLLAGASEGPFNVLEEVYLRILSNNVQTTEVVRKIGPVGNAAVSLHGRFSVEGRALAWKPSFMIDERYREVAPPGGRARIEWSVGYVSSEVLLLRRATDAQSYAVLGKLTKEKLKQELEAFSVDAEMILGNAA